MMIENENGKKKCEGRVDGADECLVDGFADDNFEIFFLFEFFVSAEIFTHAVEDDDIVVDGKTDNDQKSGDEKRVDFYADKMSEHGEKSDRNDDVVDETDDSNDAVFPRRDGLRNFSESKTDEKDDGEKDEDD